MGVLAYNDDYMDVDESERTPVTAPSVPVG